MNRIEDIKSMTDAKFIATAAAGPDAIVHPFIAVQQELAQRESDAPVADAAAARKARMDAMLAESDILNAKLALYRIQPVISLVDGDQWVVLRREYGSWTELDVCMSGQDAVLSAQAIAAANVRIRKASAMPPAVGAEPTKPQLTVVNTTTDGART